MKRLCTVSVLAGLFAWSGYAQVRPVLSAQVSNTWVWLRITGEVGSACTVQWTTNLHSVISWKVLTNIVPLPSSPYLVVDKQAVSPRRFYRAFSEQVTTNVTTTNMVWVPPGTFVMGSPVSEALRGADETQHTVTLTHGYYIGQFEVTQGEYLALMGNNPSAGTGDLNRPVEQVSWIDATNYCAHLTQRERAAGRVPVGWVYRLPTESEWECACRAGTTTAFHYGSALRSGGANFDGRYEYDATVGENYNAIGVYLGQTTAVGGYEPNGLGLHDMHGNVWEWCRDWYGAYPGGGVTDPPGAASGSYRVFRGGSWNASGRLCRSACRNGYYPSYKYAYVGFRVVLAQGQP